MGKGNNFDGRIRFKRSEKSYGSKSIALFGKCISDFQ